MAKYAGWKNYQTWNVALWIGSDPGWYTLAAGMENYAQFRDSMREIGVAETPDQVALNDSGLDMRALDRVIRDIRGVEAQGG